MFASSMGNDCTFCHVKAAYFDRAKFAEPTPKIVRARGNDPDDERDQQRLLQGRSARDLLHLPSRQQQPRPRSRISRCSTASPRKIRNVIDFVEYTQTSAADRSSTSTSRRLAAGSGCAAHHARRPEGHLRRIRYGVREDSSGGVREGAEPADDGRQDDGRRELPRIRRPQRVDGGPRHARADPAVDRRQPGAAQARGARSRFPRTSGRRSSSGRSAARRSTARKSSSSRVATRASRSRTSTSISPACSCASCDGR